MDIEEKNGFSSTEGANNRNNEGEHRDGDSQGYASREASEDRPRFRPRINSNGSDDQRPYRPRYNHDVNDIKHSPKRQR